MVIHDQPKLTVITREQTACVMTVIFVGRTSYLDV